MGNIKQFSFQAMLKSAEKLYDSEFQTERSLTLDAFADSASAIRGTVSNNLSDDRSVRAGR